MALIAWAEFRETGGDLPTETAIPLVFAAIVGSVSFWGSNIAFSKQELLPGRPIRVPAQQAVNALLALVATGCTVAIVAGEDSEGLFLLLLRVGRRAAEHVRAADRRSGHAGRDLAAERLHRPVRGRRRHGVLDNVALIVGRALVGASGSILTNLMADAMNRSIANIVAGGFGGVVVAGAGAADGEAKPVRSTGAADVAIQLAYANKVVVAPGCRMAVAQAQHTVRELADELERRGVRVDYAIHRWPAAPGHMDVLLAEADVPYDHLKEMDEINPELPQTDVALVIGANDVTNPAAREQAPTRRSTACRSWTSTRPAR